MLVLSHRGYHSEIPENTIEAFEKAIDMGVDGIETDVRLSADGIPILLHNQLTPAEKPVDELTHKELEKAFGYQIPSLEEALRISSEIIWNIELKTPSGFDLIVSIIRKHISSHKIIVSSFYHYLIKEISSLLTCECGLLVAYPPLEIKESFLRHWNKNRQVRIIIWNYEFLSEELMMAAKLNGFRNFIFGLDTPYEHQRCKKMRVDGVITDKPEFLINP